MDQSEVNALFNSDLTKVDLSYPLLTPGQKELEISECKAEKSSKGKNMLTIKLKTLFEDKSTKGEALQPGFTFTTRIMLDESEKRGKDRIQQDLKRLKVAVFGSGDGAFGDPGLYQGKRVLANVGVDEGNDEFGASNTVRFLERR